MRLCVLFTSLFFCIPCLSKNALSTNELFPTGCVPISNMGAEIKAGSNSPQLILLYNFSKDALWLNHSFLEGESSARSTPASSLCNHKWSALAIHEPDFTLQCIEVRPGSEQHIPCDTVLKGCYYEKPGFTAENTGSYWVAENIRLRYLLKKVKNRGITVPEN